MAGGNDLLMQRLPQPYGQHFWPSEHCESLKQLTNGLKTQMVMMSEVFGHFPTTSTVTGDWQVLPQPFEHLK